MTARRIGQCMMALRNGQLTEPIPVRWHGKLWRVTAYGRFDDDDMTATLIPWESQQVKIKEIVEVDEEENLECLKNQCG